MYSITLNQMTKRIDLLVTRIKTYVDLLQVQMKLHPKGSNEYNALECELDSVEVQLEFMLSIDDHLKTKQPTKHLTLIK